MKMFKIVINFFYTVEKQDNNKINKIKTDKVNDFWRWTIIIYSGSNTTVFCYIFWFWLVSDYTEVIYIVCILEIRF